MGWYKRNNCFYLRRSESQFIVGRERIQVHRVYEIDFVIDLLNLGDTFDKYRLKDSLYSLMIIFIDIERRECHFRVNGK